MANEVRYVGLMDISREENALRRKSLRPAGRGPAAPSVMGARRRGRGLRRACNVRCFVSHVLLPYPLEIALTTVSENRAPTQG